MYLRALHLGLSHCAKPTGYRWRHSRRLATSSLAALPPQQQQPTQQHDGSSSSSSTADEQAVARLRERFLRRSAAGLPGGSSNDTEVVVTGRGRHQGVDVAWRLRWRCSDGAFYEQVQAREFTYGWGFDGSERCWEVDDSGCGRQLHLDDFEAVVLAGWIRTGAWAAAGSQLLDISLDPEAVQQCGSAAATNATEASPGIVIAPSIDVDSNSAVVGLVDLQQAWPQGEQQQQEEAETASHGLAELGAGSAAGAAPSTVTMAVRLKGGKVVARVQVCGSDWHPLSMTNRVCSDVETWQFEEWQDWAPGPRFPRTTLHQSGCGGLHQYCVEAVEAVSAQQRIEAAAQVLLGSSFSMPHTPLLPPDTRFLPGLPPETPAWYCPSGHILVRPVINGRTLGYMILDTGASGFVIDPSAARELGMPSFGVLHVTGMAGKVRSNFRRGDTFELGPLLMERPLFMEMACSGLVRGAPGPLIGIVGYEVFRRAIVDIPARPQEEEDSLAAGSGVGSAAAAFAAALAGSGVRQRRPPGSASGPQALQYHIRIHSPELLGGCAEGAGGSQSSSQSSSSSKTKRRGSRWGEGWEQWLSGSAGGSSSSGSFDGGASPSSNASSSSSGGGSSGSELSALPWVPITLIANLPHMEARYTPGTRPELAPRSSMFMLDSGAGGVDVMFNARAVAGFDEGASPSKHRFIKGVGGEDSGRVRVASSSLAWMELGGVRFEGVKALLARSEGVGAGIDLSLYTAGIICGDLLCRCRLVVDYARGRAAVVPEEEEEE